jgi:hypothetical protein
MGKLSGFILGCLLVKRFKLRAHKNLANRSFVVVHVCSNRKLNLDII